MGFVRTPGEGMKETPNLVILSEAKDLQLPDFRETLQMLRFAQHDSEISSHTQRLCDQGFLAASFGVEGRPFW